MWIKTAEKLPKNNEVVLCYIEGEYEVGVFEKSKSRFRHTLGKTSLEFVEAWIPIPEYKPNKEKKDAAVLSTKKETVSTRRNTKKIRRRKLRKRN